MWSVRYIRTDDAFGKIQETYFITDIFDDFRIELTVGDELWIKSSDVTIKARSPLPFTGGTSLDWLVFYYNGDIVDCFFVPNNFDERDDKTGNYKVRLSSIQKKFFDDCQTVMNLFKSNGWANLMDGGAVTISQIKVFNQLGTEQSILNRWGFSLGDMLENMAKTEDKGYNVNSVTFPGPKKNQDDLPIIYRGLSDDTTLVTKADSFNNTFRDFNVTYLDLFKFASFAFNAFIEVRPIIYSSSGDEYLGIDVKVVPKTASVATVKSATWKERTLSQEKFRLDGVKLTSSIMNADNEPSFTYQQGNTQLGHIFSRDVNIADPDAKISSFDETLYWSAGLYENVDPGEYDIVGLPYFSQGLVEPFYSNMISSGNGYSGSIFYSGEKLLDQVQINTDVIQITKMIMTKRKKFSIEGIVL